MPFRVHLCVLPEQKSSSTESTPEDLEEQELLEYAALADFADLDLATDDWAALSDFDDLDTSHDVPRQTFRPGGTCGTSDMDVS